MPKATKPKEQPVKPKERCSVCDKPATTLFDDFYLCDTDAAAHLRNIQGDGKTHSLRNLTAKGDLRDLFARKPR